MSRASDQRPELEREQCCLPAGCMNHDRWIALTTQCGPAVGAGSCMWLTCRRASASHQPYQPSIFLTAEAAAGQPGPTLAGPACARRQPVHCRCRAVWSDKKSCMSNRMSAHVCHMHAQMSLDHPGNRSLPCRMAFSMRTSRAATFSRAPACRSATTASSSAMLVGYLPRQPSVSGAADLACQLESCTAS